MLKTITMTVNFKIHAAEWEFQEELPFDIVTIQDDITDFQLPLYDKDDNVIVKCPECRHEYPFLKLLGHKYK